jgi:hypothetical protein
VAFATFVQAEGWHKLYWGGDPPFLQEAKALGHPKLELVGADESKIEFLADRVGARWAQHVYGLGITDGANFVLNQQVVDPATRNKVEYYKRREQRMFFEDVFNGKPDAIIVDEMWARLNLSPSILESVLRGYRLRSTSGTGNSERDPVLKLYVRE